MKRLLKKLFKPTYGTDSISTGSRHRLSSNPLANFLRPFKEGLYNLQSSGWKSSEDSAITVPKIRKLTPRAFLSPLNWLRWSIDFVYRWFMTRSVSSILAALPALAVIATLFGMTIDQTRRGNSKRDASYSAKLNAALARDDLPEAALEIRSLLDSSPQREDLLIQQAVILDHQGQHAEAVEQMRRLAEEFHNGQAAYWLILKEFDLETLPNWDERKHSQFKSFMAIALRDDPKSESDDRQIKMAKYLVAVNADREALKYLEKLIPNHADLAFSAAMLSLKLGQIQDAMDYASIAAYQAQLKLDADPTDPSSRAALARAYMIRGQEMEASMTLREGLRFGDNPELRAILAEALVAWAARIKRDSQAAGQDTAGISQRLSLIAESLRAAPNHPLAIDALIEVAVDCRQSEDNEVRSLLSDALKNTDPGVLHFIRGTIATLDGDMPKAETHLRLAGQMGGTMPGLLNNLAVSLHSKEGGDLQQALRFSELALAQIPDHPYFLETYGQVLAKLGRTEDAVKNLEKALKQDELAKLILPTLIQCYRKLELDDMAKHYEEQLRKLP